MSIASEITRINTNIAAAYTACNSKGAALPQTRNSANLAATIAGMVVPESTVQFNQMNSSVAGYIGNVTYDPSSYESSSVSTYASASTSYRKDRPAGATITIPSAGTLTICDVRGSISNSVSAGSFTVSNLTPGAVGAYVLRDSNDKVVMAGLLKPTGTLRMIDAGGNTFNIRDLGGWACDGGTLKYGLIFRGCELNSDNYNISLSDAQKKLFTEFLGVRDDIDLRGNSEVDGEDEIYGTSDDITESAFGGAVDYIRLPVSPYASGVNLSNETQTAYYAALIKRIAADVASGRPCYIHCMAGADRTGTLCALIEALCGVSQSDIDKDYELTSFSSGNTRARTNSEWTGFITRVNSFSGSAFRDKVVSYALQAGVTIAEINALRNGLINGTPTALTSPYSDASVTKALTNATAGNAAAACALYQPYETAVAPVSGCVISSVQVTMGGTDITAAAFSGEKTIFRYSITNQLTHCTSDNNKISAISGEGYGATLTAAAGYTLDGATVSITMGGNDVSNYYSNGKISIPRVTGNVVITVTAASSAPAYVNQIPISTDENGSVYNTTGYKSGYRLNSSGAEAVKTGNVMLITGFIRYTYGDIIRVDKFSATSTDKQQAGVFFYDTNHTFLGSRRVTDMVSDGELTDGTTLVYNPTSPIYDSGTGGTKAITSAHYIRVAFHDADAGADNLIVTINEEI